MRAHVTDLAQDVNTNGWVKLVLWAQTSLSLSLLVIKETFEDTKRVIRDNAAMPV